MRLPKQVTICGKNFKVIKEKKSYDGGGEILPYIIRIGTKDRSNVPELFFHEVVELMLLLKGLRYSSSNGEPEEPHRFILTHKDFAQCMAELASICKGLKF